MDLLVGWMNRAAEQREPGLLRGAFEPLPPLRATNDEIRDQRIAAEGEVRTYLADHEEVEPTLLIQQAIDGYQEQDRRAERAERRATTLLGSISIITAVLGATGGILASSDLLQHGYLRIGMAVLIASAIGLFGLAALYSLQVLTSPDQWRRRATPLMLRDAAKKRGRELYVHTVAGLIDSVDWNQMIADRKARRLRRASRLFGYGLMALLVIVLLFLLFSAWFPAAPS
jgi:hypothetical protein